MHKHAYSFVYIGFLNTEGSYTVCAVPEVLSHKCIVGNVPRGHMLATLLFLMAA